MTDKNDKRLERLAESGENKINEGCDSFQIYKKWGEKTLFFTAAESGHKAMVLNCSKTKLE